MKVTKEEAIRYFEQFVQAEDAAECYVQNQEVIDSILYQIEEVIDERNLKLISKINNIKKFENRSLYIGNEEKFPKGCKSCLSGKGLSTIRKTNKCNAECKFCYYYGHMNE